MMASAEDSTIAANSAISCAVRFRALVAARAEFFIAATCAHWRMRRQSRTEGSAEGFPAQGSYSAWPSLHLRDAQMRRLAFQFVLLCLKNTVRIIPNRPRASLPQYERDALPGLTSSYRGIQAFWLHGFDLMCLLQNAELCRNKRVAEAIACGNHPSQCFLSVGTNAKEREWYCAGGGF